MSIERMKHVRDSMERLGVDTLLLSMGADLPWLTGYEAMPLERLTMLVVPRESEAVLVIPQLEAPRVKEHPEIFSIRPWAETEDPIAIVKELAGATNSVAVSDRTWSVFTLALQKQLSAKTWRPSSEITSPLRQIKDAEEIELLRIVGEATDRVAARLFAGELKLIGRPEKQVSDEMGRLLIEEGLERVNFSIVASGPNGASPHHEASDRIIGEGETVVFDFGGIREFYCSDITRTIVTGEPTAKQREVYEVVKAAQQASFESAKVGVTCESIDKAARDVIEAAGYGEFFIHRTGHGIGVEEHEDPYMVSGNKQTLVAGNAFSVEPGIYLPNEFGVRIEDIVIATENGPQRLNNADHELHVVL